MLYLVAVVLVLVGYIQAGRRHPLQTDFQEICGIVENANYMGDLLLVGDLNQEDTLEDCCRSCQENSQCNVFVYCGVPTGCRNEGQILAYKRCDLKFQQIVEDGGEPEYWYIGPDTDFTSGAFQKSTVVPLEDPVKDPVVDPSTFLPKPEEVPSVVPTTPPPTADTMAVSTPSPTPTPTPASDPAVFNTPTPVVETDPMITNTPTPSPSPEVLTDPMVTNTPSPTPTPTEDPMFVNTPTPTPSSDPNPVMGTTPFNPDDLQFRSSVPEEEDAVPDAVPRDPIVVNN